MWQTVAVLSTCVSALLWVMLLVLALRYHQRLVQLVGSLVVEEIHKQDERIQRRLSRQLQQPSDSELMPSDRPPPSSSSEGSKRFTLPEAWYPGMSLSSRRE